MSVKALSWEGSWARSNWAAIDGWVNALAVGTLDLVVAAANFVDTGAALRARAVKAEGLARRAAWSSCAADASGFA